MNCWSLLVKSGPLYIILSTDSGFLHGETQGVRVKLLEIIVIMFVSVLLLTDSGFLHGEAQRVRVKWSIIISLGRIRVLIGEAQDMYTYL